jgi:hypothetical protein
MWYMQINKNNIPCGWKQEPEDGYIKVSQEIRSIHEYHPDYVWDGETLVPQPIPEPYQPSEQDKINMKNSNLERLWQDATNYQERYISGAAIGALTIGVLQSRPKSLAIMSWINTLWNGYYYPQKDLVTWDSEPFDFSVVGPMPYSIPELTQEVFGS